MRQITSLAVTCCLLGAGVAGCATSHLEVRPASWHDPRLITRADIVRSGAVDAFDAVRLAQTHLAMSEARGQYTITRAVQATSRGRSSLTVSPQVLLVIDNIMRLELTSLHEIPADNIESIRVLSAMEATPLYGTDGGNGAIIIQTRIPESGSN